MTSESPGRLHALDGLRGIAALVVLVHHALLTVPAFAAPYFDEPVESAVMWWLTYTPLHLLWDGTGAVYLFFVLSGLVLTLPVLHSPRFTWASYYPARLLRLYLPVWGSVVLSIVNLLVVPRDRGMGSAWLDARAVEISPTRVLHDVSLLWRSAGLASPLWSLKWEVLFSLALPVFVFLAVRFRRARWLVAALTLAAIVAGNALRLDALIYLPMFMVGVLIAVSLREIQLVTARLPLLAWIGITVAAVLAMEAPWIIQGFGGPFSAAPAVVGAALIVVAAATPGNPFGRFLQNRVVQWAGVVSFSLYLVHEPIVIAAAFVAGPGNEWWAMLVSIPVSLVAAQLFYLGVERTSHRFSQWVAATVRARRAETGASTASAA